MNETTDATAILAPLWRFKWFIVGVGLAVAIGTYAFYAAKSVSYQATTAVNLANGAEEQGIPPSEPSAPRRRGGRKKEAASGPSITAANVVNSPVIHGNTIVRLRQIATQPGFRKAAESALAGAYTARGAENSQIVSIVAVAPTGGGAALLANTAAELYVERTNVNFEIGVKTAISVTRAQLTAVEASLASGTPPPRTRKTKKAEAERGNATSQALQAANLSTQLNHLQAQLSIQSIRQLGRANGLLAAKLAVDPKQNAIFGLLIGISLAGIAAYTLNRFDRRLRTLAAIESALETQVLSAMPSVRHPLVMREGELHPTRPLQEPLRRLHTTLRLGVNGKSGPRPRSILFLSPDAADGKSTVAAGLALVQRTAGEQVSLIEADFRRPVQARLLGLPLSGGLLEVLSGTLTLEEGLQRVEAPALEAPLSVPVSAAATAVEAVNSNHKGTLSVLLGEYGVSNPPAVLAEPAMAALLRSAAQDFDQVLIDAPPPLLVSDVLPLLANVDGIVLVARIGHTREASAKRLVQLLSQTASAPVLGVVANDVSSADMRRYGFSHAYGYRYGSGSGYGYSGYGRRGWRSRRKWGHQPGERHSRFKASRWRSTEQSVHMSVPLPIEQYEQVAETSPLWAPEPTTEQYEPTAETRPPWAPEPQATVEDTQATVEHTQATVEHTQAPVEDTQATVEHTQAPVEDAARTDAPPRQATEPQPTVQYGRALEPPAPAAEPSPDATEPQPKVQHGSAPESPAQQIGPGASEERQEDPETKPREQGTDPPDEDEPRGWLDRLFDR